VLLLFVLIGVPVLIFVAVWFVVRIVRGFLAWNDNMPIADPKRDTMFSSAVYYRGGMTLAALRHRIGSHDFFRLLRTWTAQHRYGTATTGQFIALAEKVSGKNLDAFFKTWLWDRTKPASFG